MPFKLSRSGLLIVISAPSGCGKSSIVRGILPRIEDLKYSISATSRTPRKDEINGKDYVFMSREQFVAEIKQGLFIEHAEVHGNFYGTPRKAVDEARSAGKDLILDIDVQGGLQVRERVPDSVLIFIVPPSLQELERRLRGRNTDPEDVIRLRLRNAENELSYWPQYDYVVTNDDLPVALDQVEAIIRGERCRASRMSNWERIFE